MSSLQNHLASEDTAKANEPALVYQHAFGSIQSPADLLSIPGYEATVDFSPESGRRLAEMLDRYDFTKEDEYPCGIKGCSTIHQHGYLVRTSDGKLTNIGQLCGKRHLNLDFTRVRKAYREKRKAADNLKSIAEIRSSFSVYRIRLDDVMARSAALARCRSALRDCLPEQHDRVVEMGRKGRHEIVRVRRMSKREAQIHYSQTRTSRKDYEGGRPTVEEVVAILAGAEFFKESLGLLIKNQILPPLTSLIELNDDQIQAMTPRDLENLSRNVNNALRLIEKAEDIAGHGMKFFREANLAQLELMDADPKLLDRVMLASGELRAFHAPQPE